MPDRHRCSPVRDGPRRAPREACRFRRERSRSTDRPKRCSIDGITGAFRARDYLCDRSLATAVFLALELGRPLLLEGEAGVGKTELAKVLAASLGSAAHPAPVLRGARHRERGLRVELPAPDARDPAPRGARRRRRRPRHLRPRVPHPAAAPPGPRGRRRRPAGPAHRRDRPGRRGVRGVSARDPVRLPGDGPGARHDQGRATAAGRPHLEPDPRGPRRPEAPLPLSLDRLPEPRPRARDRPRPGAGRARSAWPARSSRSSIASARPTSRRSPGSPRRSTGRPRCSPSGPGSSRRRIADETLGVVLKYEEDVRRIRGTTAAAYLEEVAAGG